MRLALLAAPAVLAAAVAGCVVPVDARPFVAGDSLTVQAAATIPDDVKVRAWGGTDPCGEQSAIAAAAALHPARVVLAYTGNALSPQLISARRFYGDFGVGQLYADCIRAIRARIPAGVPLVVTAAVACRTQSSNGSPIVNAYLQTAVGGGRYLSGVPVTRLPNTRYSTALDDRLTPRHVYRTADAGGVLRTPDGVHLTGYGGRVYGTVLTRLARTGV